MNKADEKMERVDYDRAVSAKESELDELKTEARQAEASLDNFEQSMMAHFRGLQAIEDQAQGRDGYANSYSEVEQKQRYLVRLMSNWREEAQQAYDQVSTQLEEEREQIQRERDAIIWD